MIYQLKMYHEIAIYSIQMYNAAQGFTSKDEENGVHGICALSHILSQLSEFFSFQTSI